MSKRKKEKNREKQKREKGASRTRLPGRREQHMFLCSHLLLKSTTVPVLSLGAWRRWASHGVAGLGGKESERKAAICKPANTGSIFSWTVKNYKCSCEGVKVTSGFRYG